MQRFPSHFLLLKTFLLITACHFVTVSTVDLFFHPLTCFLIKLFVLILGLQKCCKDNSKSFLPYTQFPPML